MTTRRPMRHTMPTANPDLNPRPTASRNPTAPDPRPGAPAEKGERR